jgi:hypothetical protein
MLRGREQQVDVFHGAQSRLGVAASQGWTLQHDWLEADVGERMDRQRDSTGQEEQRLHSVHLENVAQCASGFSERIELVGDG